MVAKKIVKSGAKCTCNWGTGVLALILFAVGFWVLVNGFVTQWISKTTQSGTSYWQIMLWYLGGFVLLALAKMSKWSAYSGCSVHSMS